MTDVTATDYTLCSIYLYLTGGCNLACAHCWISPDHVPSTHDAPEGITAAFGPEAAAFAWVDPVGRRIRMPGPAAAWVGL